MTNKIDLTKYEILRKDLITSLEPIIADYEAKGLDVTAEIDKLIWLGYIKEIKKAKKE